MKKIWEKVIGTLAGKSADEVYKLQQSALEKKWDENKGLTSKLSALEGLSGERYKATKVSTEWLRDTDVEGDAKPPVMVRRINLNVTAEGANEPKAETMSFYCRLDVNGDFEYIVRSQGEAAIAEIVTSGPAKAAGTLEAWVHAVKDRYGLPTLTDDVRKREARYTSAHRPAGTTAKP